MKLFLALVAFALILTKCNKDKFTTDPQVTVKSISPNTVHNGDIVSLKSRFSDDEGDIDQVLIVYKWYEDATAVLNDTFRYSFSNLKLPVGTRQGDLNVTFEYNTDNFPDIVTLTGVSERDTTATLGLLLVDKKGHRSNYSESDKIRLIRP